MYYLIRFFVIVVSAVCLSAPLHGQNKSKRPNILFFLVDDMGWQDCSLPFHTERTRLNDQYRTPNMEKLARQGVMFTQAYASAVCSPSRVSLMTGQNAARHGVTCWTLNKDKSPENGRVINGVHPPEWPYNGLCPDDSSKLTAVCPQTLPKLLKDAGYFTVHVGKAHFGAFDTSGNDPRNFGFDVNIAGHAAGGPGSYHGVRNFSAAWRGGGNVWDVPGLEKYHGQDIYLTDALTREAIAQLEANRKSGKPFYLYMSHYAVHAPFEEDPKFAPHYEGEQMSKHHKVYATMIEGMDESLGRIVKWLADNKELDNTLIIFMSDNGTPRENPSNKPLRGHKITAYEGGTRVPMIVRLPRAFVLGRQADKRCDMPVIIEDIYPTILETAGIKWKNTVKHKVDGVSMMPLLLGKGDGMLKKDRELLWHYPNTYDIAPWSSLRTGDWKLICHYAGGKLELYNLKDDIGESRNLLVEQPAVAERMAKRLTRLLKERGGNMPRNADGTLVPYPDAYLP